VQHPQSRLLRLLNPERPRKVQAVQDPEQAVHRRGAAVLRRHHQHDAPKWRDLQDGHQVHWLYYGGGRPPYRVQAGP